MWKYYAILSALFAALTAIFAKLGIKNIDSDLATAIRTCIVLLLTWTIVLTGNSVKTIKDLTAANWSFLVLSGIATGLSWLFYFKALQLGDASKVAPIDKLSVVFTIFLSFVLLKEAISWKVIMGGLLIASGSILILMDKQ